MLQLFIISTPNQIYQQKNALHNYYNKNFN